MRELIIDTPSVLNLRQRTSTAFLSFIFWLLWFYLWIPLTTFLGWYLSFDLVHYQIVELQHNIKFVGELYFFVKAVVLFASIFIIWVTYNYLRFRYVERRTQSPHITSKDLADRFNVNLFTLIEHQSAKYVSVSFDEDGNIVSHTSINLMDNNLFVETLKDGPMVGDGIISDM